MFSIKFFCTLTTTTLLSRFVSAACNEFAPINCPGYSSPTYTTTSEYSYPVSKGMSCPASTSDSNQTCTATGGGWVTAYSTLNITTSNPTTIYKLISGVTDRTLPESTTGTLNNFTFDVQPGASVYYGFTPFLVCVEGRLRSCETGGDVPSDTAVQACGPYYINDDVDNKGFGILDGAVSRVVTDKEITERLPCNLANSTMAKAGTNPSNYSLNVLESDDPRDNVASNMGPSGRTLVLSFGVMLILVGLSLGAGPM